MKEHARADRREAPVDLALARCSRQAPDGDSARGGHSGRLVTAHTSRGRFIRSRGDHRTLIGQSRPGANPRRIVFSQIARGSTKFCR